MAWDQKCPNCSSSNWFVRGSSNCVCRDCQHIWIVTAASARFPDHIMKVSDLDLDFSGVQEAWSKHENAPRIPCSACHFESSEGYPASHAPGCLVAAEQKWNEEHELTATCPVCLGPMKEGREFCTWRCWHKSRAEQT